MKLFDVYSLFEVEPISARGSVVVDKNGVEYLDFYGGHAVISIGHSHPHFVKLLKDQIDKMIFYSNSVENSIQERLALKLGEVSGLDNYELFLCNSGAEAVENAIKLASFYNGRKKVLAIKNSFHGRTSVAANITDNESIKSPINKTFECDFISMNDEEAFSNAINSKEYAAIIIEPIQGIGGLDMASKEFLELIEKEAKETDTIFIADEIQCGSGRSGHYFAFQIANVKPDIITMAKGFGNGYPIGGVLINAEKIKSSKGLLGSTFGGNHLACVAGLSVLEVIEQEELLSNTKQMGNYLIEQMKEIKGIKNIKGRGLMLGIEFDFPVAELRKELVYNNQLFTGSSKNPNQLRILPALNITKDDCDLFISKLTQCYNHMML